jgi:hypothetical protein
MQPGLGLPPAANIPSHIVEILSPKHTRIAVLRDDYVHAWLKLCMNMGDYDTERRRSFIEAFEKQLEEEDYPAENPQSEDERDQYMDWFLDPL